MTTARDTRESLLPAERAAELLDELLFHRVLDHVDVAGLQQLESELWTTLIDLDVDLQGRSPIAEARALVDRAIRRFLLDFARVMSLGDGEDQS